MTRHAPLRVLGLLCLTAATLTGCDETDSGVPFEEAGDTDACENETDCDAPEAASASPLRRQAFIPILPAHRLEGAGANGTEAAIWSGVQLQNLSQQTTDLTLTFYNPDGSERTSVTETMVAPGASANFITHMIAENWSGYAVGTAENNGRVEATVNLNEAFEGTWDTATAGDAFEATTELGHEFALPYLDLSEFARTTIWVVNPTSEAASMTLELASGTSLNLGEVSPGQQRGIHLLDVAAAAGLSADDVIVAAASAGKTVGSAILRTQSTSGFQRAEVAVAVTSVESGRTMTAYTPPQFGANLAPLVNFQPKIDLDTVIYAQRLEGQLQDDSLLDDVVSVEYRFRDQDGDRFACTEHVSGVQVGEVVDFGWSFTDRPYTEAGQTRHSSCPLLDQFPDFITADTDVAVGWARLSTNATAVVAQEYTRDGIRRRSAYSGAWKGKSAAESLSFSLVQTDNPLPASHHSNWSGISVVNPNAQPVTVECRFYNGVPGVSELDQIRTRSNLQIGAFESLDLQMYDIWAGERFYGSATCTSVGGPIMGLANQQYGWSGAPMSYRAVPAVERNCEGLLGTPALTCADDGFLYRDGLAADGCFPPIDSCTEIASCTALAESGMACLGLTPADPQYAPLVQNTSEQCIAGYAQANSISSDCLLASVALNDCGLREGVCEPPDAGTSACFSENAAVMRACVGCDPELLCGQAVTCFDGVAYPDSCGPDACGQPCESPEACGIPTDFCA